MFVSSLARSLAHPPIHLAILLIRVNFTNRLYSVLFSKYHFVHVNMNISSNKKHAIFASKREGKEDDNSAGKMRNGSLFILRNDDDADDDDGDEHHHSNKMSNSKRQLEKGRCMKEVNMKKRSNLCFKEKEMRKRARAS